MHLNASFPKKLLRPVKTQFLLVSLWAGGGSIKPKSPEPPGCTTEMLEEDCQVERRGKGFSLPVGSLSNIVDQQQLSHAPTPTSWLTPSNSVYSPSTYLICILGGPRAPKGMNAWMPASWASSELLGKEVWPTHLRPEPSPATWNLLNLLISFPWPWLSDGAASCSYQLCCLPHCFPSLLTPI